MLIVEQYVEFACVEAVRYTLSIIINSFENDCGIVGYWNLYRHFRIIVNYSTLYITFSSDFNNYIRL